MRLSSSLPLAALLFGFVGCAPEDRSRDMPGDPLKTSADADADTAADAASDAFTLSVVVSCAEDADATGECTSLRFDASESTSASGDIVSWKWVLDGTAYTTAALTHTFPLDPDEETSYFVGTLTLEDAAGETLTADIQVSGTILMSHGGSDPGDPEHFWFSGVTPRDDVYGPGCQMFITAVSGCLESNFTLRWRDDLSQDLTWLLRWFAPPSSTTAQANAQYLTYVLYAQPARLDMRLELPTMSGAIEVIKPGVSGMITHHASCGPAMD